MPFGLVNLSDEQIQKLITMLNSVGSILIAYNAKFDIRFLQKEGLNINGKSIFDVLPMVRLIEHSNVNMLSLTETIKRRYGIEHAQYDIDTKKALRQGGWTKDFSKAPIDILGPYCEKDVFYTRKIYFECLQQLEKTKQLDIWTLQVRLTRVLFDMENKGVKVDTNYVKKATQLIASRKQEIEQKIKDITTGVFDDEYNIASTQQMGPVFQSLNISSPEKTAKGNDSWNEAALAQINHPIAGLVRQWRTLEKLRSTYLEPFENEDGLDLHTDFCNWGTVTGRLSSRNPNLQNVPRNHFKVTDTDLSDEDLATVKNRVDAVIATKGGKSVELSNDVIKTWAFIGDESFDETDDSQISLRRLIVPRDNTHLVSFDYSQMEVRVFLSYIAMHNEAVKKMLQQSDVDFHGEAAKLAFKIDENHKDYKYYRQTAKAITFGTIYGIGNAKLATQLNVSPTEAGEYKKRYFEGITGSREFFDNVVKKVESQGWVKNRYGRVYRIDKNFGYKGVNYLVQGTSADIMSERMIEIHKYLDDKKSNLLLQVHDEIICEVHEDEVQEVLPKIKELLKINSLGIPLDVDMEVCSPSWATKVDASSLITTKQESVEEALASAEINLLHNRIKPITEEKDLEDKGWVEW
jgi:DNA polymerase-1